MRSPALKKQKQIHGEPPQHEESAKDNYDGKRTSGMANVLAILKARLLRGISRA
jgi:hypothetical protein